MNKIIFILFLTISFSLAAISQNDTINQLNENGLKTAYWKYYHENGNIKSEGNYNIIPLTDSEELFMEGIYDKDTVFMKSVKDGLWKEFSKNGNLIIYEYWENGNINSKYIKEFNINVIDDYDDYDYYKYNKKESFNFQTVNFVDKYGSIKSTFLILPDILKKDSIINYKISSDRIINIETIKEDSLHKLKFNYLIATGHHYDTIKILHDDFQNINEVYRIYSFGYNFSCNDMTDNLNTAKTIIINSDTLYFYREKRVSEMKIYKFSKWINENNIVSDNLIPVKTIPVSLNYNVIPLTELKKGKYIVRIINYRYNKNSFTIIELK